jgi:hypothetical protein
MSMEMHRLLAILTLTRQRSVSTMCGPIVANPATLASRL